MVDAVKELGTPSLHTTWSEAKKKAEIEAKKAKQADKFTTLEKKFKSDFGPNLDKWPKLYPDFSKLKTGCTALQTTLKTYKDFVKAAGLDDKAAKPMVTALDSIKNDLQARLSKAETLIASDVNLAIAASKKTQRTPIIVFHLDVAAQVMKAAGDKGEGLEATRIDLDVVLSDPEVLKKVPNDLDDAVLANKIREAANFKKVIDDIADGFAVAAKTVRENPKSLGAAETKFKASIDSAIEAAVTRAVGPIDQLAKVKTSYRNYKIKTGVDITLKALGTASGAVALGLAPLTLGASSVIGMIGTAKGAVALGNAIANASEQAEVFAARVAAAIAELGKQYATASKNAVGGAEIGKTLVNATMPTLITTIKSASGDCETLGKKVDGLEVATHKKAELLGKMLTDQSKLQGACNALEKVKGDFGDAEAKKAEKLIKSTEAVDKEVEGLIKKVDTLHTRMKATKETHRKLAEKMAAIASKEPTWAQVAEVVINAGAAAGFLAAGNVGVPEPYAVAKLANDINSQIGNVVGSLDALKSGFEDLKGIAEKAKR
ncbi:MAG: hypothetical protein KF788_13525 [Piscinibacter sp.]|nr:hypothetical protein [Piscinibacter sp.]